MDRATAYAQGVSDGDIIAGPDVRAACARHLRDLEEGPDRGLEWRPDLAARVIDYFETVLRLAGGEHEGQPFNVLGWQDFVLGSVFGWLGPDGYRRFRVAYVETGKGSGKSPMAGGIGLYCLTADDEPRAEIYAAATKRDQAMILFRDAVAMVDQSDALSARIHKSGKNPVYNLLYRETSSFFRPLASDDAQSGPRPHCALLDEIHEHRSPMMVEMMRAGTKGRRQALIFMITNSGVDRTSVCYDRHLYGQRVCSGALEDDSFFAYICGVDEGDDPIQDEDDPELGYPRSWAKANPSLGVTIPVQYLREQVREAKGMPAKESVVRRLNFCEWVDAASPWISGEVWRGAEIDALEYRVTEEPAFAGLDLSGKRDLTALALYWPHGEGGSARVEFWTPGDNLVERSQRDRVPYDAWASEGHLHAPPGRSIDYSRVAARIAELWHSPGLLAMAFDPYRMEDLQRELEDLDVPCWIYEGPDKPAGHGLMLVRHGQGFGGGNSDTSLWMPRSIGQLEDRLTAGTIAVEENPCLRWNAASAVLKSDAQENRKWEKRKSTGRIDGVVALSMAVGVAEMQAQGRSVYESRGMRVL